jgi:dGTPase
MEHVHHVASVSYTIANFLGLNTELTQAIAISHDIGHAPFGHEGETRLSKIAERETGKLFWHEQNGLYVADKIATLPDNNNNHQNFKLTYAVRDGIVSHCGEIDENGVRPRDEFMDLYQISKAGSVSPYTWEACVVKISDKIAYLGRDIEDAIELNFLDNRTLVELRKLIEKYSGIKTLNNTVLIHGLIIDLCQNSTLEAGLLLSDKYYELIKDIKAFNYEYIYKHPRIKFYQEYSEKIINTIYDFLASYWCYPDMLSKINQDSRYFRLLMGSFHNWLIKYSDANEETKLARRYENTGIYKLRNEQDYKRAIIDFIAGMTDSFAIKAYHEIITF